MALLGIGILLFFLGIPTVGILLVRRFVPVSRLRAHNDVAGPIFATLGVIYAVLLAFVVIVSWQNFDRAQMNVVAEANNYANIYRNSAGFDEAFRNEVKKRMDAYLRAVIDDEWPRLGAGGRSPLVQELAAGFWLFFGSYEPRTEREKIFYAEAVSQMNEAGEYRRQRLVDAQTGIHPMLWAILLVGGLITVVFTCFFGSETLGTQLIMTSMLALLIAMSLLTILMLDHPFTGRVSIPPEAFMQVLSYISGS